MGALIWYQLRQFAMTAKWLAPLVGFVVLTVALTGFQLETGHGAVVIPAALVAITAWFGWLLTSGSAAPLWHLDMVAAGGRERVLIGRWITSLLCAVPPLVIALTASTTDTRPWPAVLAIQLLAALFGATLGVQLGVWLTRRDPGSATLPQDLSAVTPLAGLSVVLASALGPIPYLGVVAGFGVLLVTVGLTVAGLTERW